MVNLCSTLSNLAVMPELSQEEKARYNRHIILPEVGLEGQQKLKDTSVLVIGAGGLGCPLLQYLAAAGVGKIGIVDFDVVDTSNLHRQILFTTSDVGHSKSQVARDRLLANNPHIEIKAYKERITPDNALQLIGEYNLVADGSDNFATRYLVDDACVLLGKPLIFGAIYKFGGQLSVFNYKNGPSYRCLFPNQPSAESIPTCSQIGVMGVLPGIIGSMMANEVIKVILEKEDTLSGKFLTVDIMTNQFMSFDIAKNEENFKRTELGNYSDNCELESILSISVDELHEAYDDYFVLDIRDLTERKICQLPQSVHIIKDEVEDLISLIPRDKPVVVYCHFGKQSKDIVEILTQKYGYNKVYNLDGGIHEWSQEIDNSVLVY